MIYLHTGTPGAGKTLYTLDHVRERAKRENRAVYYHGIEILKPEDFPGWERFDSPDKWYELPDGAIIVHDECQGTYRPRSTGSAVPECVARFETHRHQGHDIYLITQHPMLVDGNVRRLAGEHVHVHRAWGAQFATVHRWQQVNERCDKSRKDSVTENYLYNRALFDAYKSATVHTHKVKLPLKLLWIPLALSVGGVAVWYLVHVFAGMMGDQVPASSAAQDSKSMSTTGSPERAPQATQHKTALEWAEERRPRVVGLPHTAPVYDGVTAPKRAPYPAGCIANEARCVCYTQQGTRMAVDAGLCRQIADTGYFVEWDTGEDRPDRRSASSIEGAGRLDRSQQGEALIADSGRWGGVR